ncbi:hypothetical protein TWF718_002117 [Orbilia javanica]|uniref:Uncharacterized protein n=1 Tax=Orbilia javanica TaxID=47235 RepID=A0AAN8MM11_9PEZI
MMLNRETIKEITKAVLLLSTLIAPTFAWYMQQATTQNLPNYLDGRKTGIEPAYLSQSSDEPLTFDSCITINWGNLNDNTKINYFSLSRDLPPWDNSKTREENLINVVRGIIFFEGANCEPLTSRIIFRLDDNYKPGSYLFLTSQPVQPPLRLGSWRPIWLYGQGGYSDSLSQIEVGGFKLLPPPRDLARLVQQHFPLIHQQLQEQQQQEPVLNQQQQQPGVIPILPNTRQQTGNQENRIQRNNDPRERLTFDEIIRDQPEGERDEESPSHARLRRLTDQVENLQRVLDNMQAERRNNNNNREPTQNNFEEEKQDYVEQPIRSNDLMMSPASNPSWHYSPGPSQGDISNFFGINSGNQEGYADENFGTLQRSASGTQYFTGNFLNPSREGTFSFLREDNASENQRDIVQEEQAPPVQEEQIENNQQTLIELNPQRAEGENNPAVRDHIIEEPAQIQDTGLQEQSQENTQQGNLPTVNNRPVSEDQIEMPPPTRPSRHQSQTQYLSDVSLALENNRLRYAQGVNSKFTPYFNTLTNILATTGQEIQEALIVMARDPNTGKTDEYLAAIEQLLNLRKEYMIMNEDKFLEAARNVGAKLRADNAIVLNSHNRNVNQQAVERRYGSLNGGIKREDV